MFDKAPGEHALLLDGVIGPLEACLTIPEVMRTQYVAILGHPHSLQGGTMNNKIVTTLARTFKELGIASVRFNFRGVGASFGTYDAGVGESEDMLRVAEQCLEALPGAALCFAGFSFGSYVTYRAAAHLPHVLLISIAPPVHHYDYSQWTLQPSSWFIVQGDQDEVSPLSLVLDFAKQAELEVLRFKDAGHFFHGQLIALKTQLLEVIPKYIAL